MPEVLRQVSTDTPKYAVGGHAVEARPLRHDEVFSHPLLGGAGVDC